MAMMIIKLAARFPHSNPLVELLANRLGGKAAESLVTPEGVPKVGNPLSGKPDVELTQGANESLREIHIN